MEDNPFLNAIHVLDKANIPYVVVGGFAVVMHGVSRFTPDVNVVIPFDEESLSRVSAALEESPFKAFSNISFEQFKSPSERERLFKEGHWFFSFIDEEAPTFRVDLAIHHPIPFEELRAQALCVDISGVSVPIASYEHLLKLKNDAGRGQDLADTENLEIANLIRNNNGDAAVIKEKAPQSAQDRVEDLIEFYHMNPDQKVDWLLGMLTEIAKFCII